MRPTSELRGPLKRRRAARTVRALDREALRAEFELDQRPRGLARLKAFAASVDALEGARLATHATPTRAPAAQPQIAAAPPRAARR